AVRGWVCRSCSLAFVPDLAQTDEGRGKCAGARAFGKRGGQSWRVEGSRGGGAARREAPRRPGGGLPDDCPPPPAPGPACEALAVAPPVPAPVGPADPWL